MQSASPLILKRPRAPKALISLVPMIDVMLILLVFFMVTSTYLNLDMIPSVSPAEAAAEAPAPGITATDGAAPPLLIRLGADGMPAVQGQSLTPDALRALLQTRLAAAPAQEVLILPSGAADMQALVSLLDMASTAGVRNLKVVRLAATTAAAADAPPQGAGPPDPTVRP
ncbi:ExbD/TolR family protein [Phaeovulum sp. W22_SRMD_FR3]|uniref:ExbD/TolR family protein n=1 Tax=Phaeovulum sp. W22_SRMD_FR3 TaxID=3240274 RepID=UPI003F9DE934